VFLETSMGPSVDNTTDHPESSEASLVLELRTQILEIDSFQQIDQDESVVLRIKDLLHRLKNSSLGNKFIKFAIQTQRDHQAELIS